MSFHYLNTDPSTQAQLLYNHQLIINLCRYRTVPIKGQALEIRLKNKHRNVWPIVGKTDFINLAQASISKQEAENIKNNFQGKVRSQSCYIHYVNCTVFLF